LSFTLYFALSVGQSSLYELDRLRYNATSSGSQPDAFVNKKGFCSLKIPVRNAAEFLFMTLHDDTQPRSPFKTPPHVPVVQLPPDEQEDFEPAPGGPGCLVWGILGVIAVGFAAFIMILAGVAGWSSGQRVAQTNATATQYAAINEQLNRIPGDVSTGNQVLLQKRIEYLATLTPGVPGLADIMQTATALYINNQPTAAPTATATLEPTETVVVPAETSEAQPTAPLSANGALDLNALLTDAQNAIAVRDWDTAIESLDIILSADSTFEANTVRSLMSQALNTKAHDLLLSPDLADLAEGVVLTDRAKEFGDISDISYESFIASQYLDGIAAIGINYPLAIQKLAAVYNTVPTYRDVGQQLFSQYVGYGDAWVAQGEFCPAAAQYQAAVGLFNDAGASAKLTNAQTMCSQATPVGAPPGSTAVPGSQPIAPVGVG
jgi:hypothetical protein